MGGKGSGFTREKRLVDKQLGRNIKHLVLPAGDDYIIPNYSGVGNELKEGLATDLGTEGSVLFLNSTGNITEDNFNLFWNDATNELQPNLLKITSDGTQASPALKFNDTNTGFFKSGDSVRFSLNNSTKMTIDATGLLVIGTVQGVTQAEFDTLTDNSMADALHRHSELSVPDGDPDRVLTIDGSAVTTINTLVPSSLTTNLLGYWKLDGDSTDEIGSVDGTDADITYSDANGIINNGAGFNGSTSEINFGNNLDAGSGAYSVMAWFKSSDNAVDVIIAKSNAGFNPSWRLATWDDGKIRGEFRLSSSRDQVISANDMTDGNWHMAVMTRPASGGNVSLYIDDETVVTIANSSFNTTNSFNLKIGEDDNGNFDFNGAIDEVAIWDKELSSAEVAELYNSGVGNQHPFSSLLAEKVTITTDGVGIGTTSPDTQLQVVGDLKVGDDNTNYLEVSTTGDLTFVGTAGLPFAEIYARDNTTTTSTSTTKAQILIFDTNGESNNMTPDHAQDHITVVKAGKYKIDASISIKNSSGAAHVISLEMYKNNGTGVFNNIHAGRTLGTSTDVGNLTMSGLVDLAVNDTIEFWITSDSASARTVTVEDIDFCAIQIGGT